MNRGANILNRNILKVVSIALTMILCLHSFSVLQEEEIRENKREIETEVVLTISKQVSISEKENLKKIIPRFPQVISDSKVRNNTNVFPYKKPKLYIFNCQWALKGC